MTNDDAEVGAEDSPAERSVTGPSSTTLITPDISPVSLSPSSSGDAESDPYFPSPSLASTDRTSLLSQADLEQPIDREAPFAVSAEELSDMIKARSTDEFKHLGGLDGLAQKLRTDYNTGLDLDETHPSDPTNVTPTSSATDIEAPHEPNLRAIREDTFGTNRLPDPKIDGFFRLAWEVLKDKNNVILIICATIGIVKGLWQLEFSECIDGIVIATTVTLVVLIAATTEWKKERQFFDLAKRKDDRWVQAIRSGRRVGISFHDILVGDVLCLKAGDVVPADGVLIARDSCHNISCDDSCFTGESRQGFKIGGQEAYRRLCTGPVSQQLDPFIFSGSKIMNGIGTYLVTGVGAHSVYGRIRMSVQQPRGKTPLEQCLDTLAGTIQKYASALAALLFAWSMYTGMQYRQLQEVSGSAIISELLSQALQALIQSTTLLVVAIPEGLPLAVKLPQVFSAWKMSREHNVLVRNLPACEVMSNATTLCTDKTGTLTMNEMQVMKGILGTVPFVQDDAQIPGPPLLGISAPERPVLAGHESRSTLFLVPARSFDKISPEGKNLLVKSFALNSTADKQERDGQVSFSGCQTESALLRFAEQLDRASLQRVSKDSIVEVFHFNSRNKYMATVERLPGGSYRLYVKGAPEIVMGRCSDIVADPTKPIHRSPMTTDQLHCVTEVVDGFASDALRTLATAYRDLPTWPQPGLPQGPETCNEQLDLLCQNLTFIGVFGIQDPLRPDVEESISLIQRAGVTVRMVTGDSIKTAEAIAKACGIKTSHDTIMEAREFESLPESRKASILPGLRVLARSTPDDKERLVLRLKARGDTVAVTGDGTNDGPALKAGHAGISMGSGTEVAKEASSMVLLNDNFSALVPVVLSARAAYDAIKKFLRFQLAVNIGAILLTILHSTISETILPGVDITTVQWLWVNVIMDSLAALFYASDEPDPGVLDRSPEGEPSHLSSLLPWTSQRMIFGQGAFMVAVTSGLGLVGGRVLSYTRPGEHLSQEQGEVVRTLVFNTFIWLVFFNLINNRRLDNKFNAFEGLHRSRYCMAVLAVIAVIQVGFIQFGGSTLHVTPLNGTEWAVCVSLGFLTILSGIWIRLLHDGTYRKGRELTETSGRRTMRMRSHSPNHTRRRFSGVLRSRRQNGDIEAALAERTPLLVEHGPNRTE
ncbi:hypothetical protein B0T16DRAFT_518598 [Cercophora newfieldiana]|uniref:Calcium-transporting ATPase n=1 Tax=Cercophora newfieldiana TaxID=92897 RepID=A0AA39XTZ4_9PEZI|nr:hypothetical protein B0T16DRAFT_518598 [Cercophora newfieldiana]